jgi:hypothetical protein
MADGLGKPPGVWIISLMLCSCLSDISILVLYLIRANHSKGWDAKLLAYVPRRWNRVAGLPGVA